LENVNFTEAELSEAIEKLMSNADFEFDQGKDD
jgi:hypothetical protein